MATLAEDGVRSERVRESPGIGTKPESCPVHSRLLNLWLTGEWQCPACGYPDQLAAARLHEEYIANPKTESIRHWQNRSTSE
jgi:hypothetical protein